MTGSFSSKSTEKMCASSFAPRKPKRNRRWTQRPRKSEANSGQAPAAEAPLSNSESAGIHAREPLPTPADSNAAATTPAEAKAAPKPAPPSAAPVQILGSAADIDDIEDYDDIEDLDDELNADDDMIEDV